MLKKMIYIAAGLLVLGAGYWLASRPDALLVETATVNRGPMEVSVEEQGETRAHDHFTITAPVAGRLTRIELHVGDAIVTGQAVAVLQPMPLDTRSLAEAQARVASAQALQSEAMERVAQAVAHLELTGTQLARAERLLRTGDVPRASYDQAKTAEMVARRDVEAARFRESAARHEVERARSALAGTGSTPQSITLRSPAAGRVTRIAEKSERVLQTGEPILTVGDTRRLEVTVDVLSADAVRIRPGQTAWLEEWGGDRPLRAIVQTVEPLGFTKISALGVEEKRVPVRLDFVDPPGRLGDGYRVEVRVIVWSSADVLKAPASAIFRCGDEWCTFVAEGNRAVRRVVAPAHRNSREVEITHGLRAGQTVIVHPPRDLFDGALIQPMGGNRI